MTDSQPALTATNLVRRYGGVSAVDHVDLTVQRGSLTALLGPSGCGKTTVLRLIAGLERPDEGTISLSGKPVEGPGLHVSAERRGVGLVFQDNVLFPHLTVAGNVGYGVPSHERSVTTARMLELVGLAGLDRRLPHEVSGGQQQRAALARTLAADPQLVLLDEPFSQLDAHLREQVRSDMVEALQRTKSTALLVTHDQDEALALADEVIVMANGRIHQVGSPRDIYQRPADRFVAEFIGDATLIPARMTADGLVGTDFGELVALGRIPSTSTLAVVRPEAVRIGSATSDEPGARRALVTRVVFQGRDNLVELTSEHGIAIKARSAGTDPVSAGDPVSVTVQGPVALV